MDFIDSYSGLDDNERQLFAPQEDKIMMTWSERLRSEGMQKGILQGRQLGWQEGKLEGKIEGKQEGELAVLTRLLSRRFGALGAATIERLRRATPSELEHWADNILDAQTLEEVFGQG
jgi:flagellar biosynthesis/type III secretory pathway protein FliH